MDVFNTNIEAGHEDEIGRSIAGIQYSRYHILEDKDISELVAPGRLPSYGVLYQIWRDRIKKWQYDFQGQIMAYFLDGVTSTCDHMGGGEVFDQTTTAGRMDLWEAIFDEAPVAIAQEMLGTVGRSVPLDDIFSLHSPQHKKWQRFHKTVFMFTAEDTYAHRYATLDDDKEEVFEKWRSFPFSDECESLNLGGVKEIPVKAGGPLDQGRRKAPRKITYPAGYRVAVSASPLQNPSSSNVDERHDYGSSGLLWFSRNHRLVEILYHSKRRYLQRQRECRHSQAARSG